MPKILINENDYSNPGAANSYSNYAVLVAGFMGDGDGKKVAPDSNGVYEFSSYQDFVDTIGLVAPEYTYDEDGEHPLTVYHYGNQMAYELLKLGYPVIYLPIDPEGDMGIRILEDANTWEIFKDKVNYDFRFVTHGLLKSYVDGGSNGLEDRLEELENALSYLKEALSVEINIETDNRLEITNALEEAYGDLLEQALEGEIVLPSGIINPKTGETYMSLEAALYGTSREGADIGSIGIITELKNKKALYDKRVATGVKHIQVLDAKGNPVLDENGMPKFKVEDTGTISKANTNIANLAKYVIDESGSVNGRGDCIALIELDENEYNNVTIKPETKIIAAINRMSGINKANGKYCAMTVPSVVYASGLKMPGAFHYLACFINAMQSGFAEWYAAAGYTRGVSSHRIANTTVTLGEIAINALEPRNTDGSANSPTFACNVIANFRGSYYLWGNRTAHPLGDAKGTDNDLSASHFLNIRQLCTTIKKQLYVACRRFTFDPNSDTLWFNFVNAIRPTLDTMKADQGIRDYKILKVAEANQKKATLKAKIRIIPIEAVEDFDIEVSLEDSFGETAVSAAESI